MITVEEARKKDPTLKYMSDEEIALLLQAMYETVELSFDFWWQKKCSKNPAGLFLERKEKYKL